MNSIIQNIAIVVPVYNEQEIIKTVITDLKNKLSNTNYKIIILNDGSTDRTWEQLKIFTNDEKVLLINKKMKDTAKL